MVEGGDDLTSPPAPAADPWYVSATAAGPTPPPAVSKFWVDRVCDHTFRVRWKWVDGATGYDLEIRGQNWQRLFTNQKVWGFQFKHWTKDATFRIRIRSVNAHGVSDWRKVKSVAPACAVEGLQASYAANGKMRVTWNPATRATGYDVNFSADNGRSWQRMADNLNATTYAFTKDPQALPYNPNFLVAVQSLKHGVSAGWRNAGIAQIRLTASDTEATSATLNLAGHSGQWWYDADTGPDSACQGPVSGASDNLTGLTEHQQYTYTAYGAAGCNSADLLASITFEPAGDVLTAESVTATTATLKLENHTGNWWFKRTAPDAGTCTAGDSTDYTDELTGLIPGTEYTYKSYDVDTCAASHEGASVTFTTVGVSVSNLDETDTQVCGIGAYEGFTDRAQCGAVFTTGSAPNGYTLHSVTLKFGPDNGTPGAFDIALHAASGDYPASSAIQNATLTGNAPRTAGYHTYTCTGAGCALSKDTTYFVVMSSPDSSNDSANYYRWRQTTSSNVTKIPSSPDNGWSIADKAVGRFGGNWYKGNYADMMKVAATVNPPASLTASAITDTTAMLTIANRIGNWRYQYTAPSGGTCSAAQAGTGVTLTGLTPGTSYTFKAYSDDSCASANAIATAAAFTTAGGSVSNLSEATDTVSFVIGNAPSPGQDQQYANAFTTGDAPGGYTLNGVRADFSNKTGSPSDLVMAIHPDGSGDASGSPAASAKATLSGANPDAAGEHTYTCSTGCGLTPNTTYFLLAKAPGATGGNAYSWRTTASDNQTSTISGDGWSIGDTVRYSTGGSGWLDGTGGKAVRFKVAATAKPGVAASAITDTTATLTLRDYAGSWWLKRTTPADTTCKSKGTTATEDLTGLTAGTSYTYKAYSKSECHSADEIHTVSFNTLVALDVSNVAGTTATLTIAGHSGNWRYQYTTPSGGTCSDAQAGTSANVAGLTRNVAYVFKAYSDDNCATEIAKAAPFATPLTVSNLNETAYTATFCRVDNLSIGGGSCGFAFTTGSASGGYAVESATVNVTQIAPNNSPLEVEIRAADGINPADTALMTLSRATLPTVGNNTYACASNCGLAASTTYFLHLRVQSGAVTNYTFGATQSDAETKAPSDNGWSLGDTIRSKTSQTSAWEVLANSVAGQFRVTAGRNAGLSVTATATTATLTLSEHTAAWWYQGSQSGASCTSVASGAASVSTLTASTQYSYTAYDKPGCAAADEIASATFITPAS